METVHGTCVAIDGKGVLIRGPSGSGKSDLALRLIDGGALLVADDVVALRCNKTEVIASLPEQGAHLRGILEVRGVGLLKLASQDHVPVDLSVDLASPGERLPDQRTSTLAGVDVATVSLNPFEASAPAKIRAALMAERVA